MVSTIKRFRTSLAKVDLMANRVPAASCVAATKGESSLLWRSQFVWGYHGLALAAERCGHFQDASEMFEICVKLIGSVAPGSGYELKYHMMLLQCLARQVLTGAPGVSGKRLKEALRQAEDAHGRCYGG